MASLALSCLAVSILFFQITSCSKAQADPTPCPTCPTCDTIPTPKYPVTGLWEGTYTTDQVSHEPTYTSFAIYSDGSFIKRAKVVGKNEYALMRGRWTISDNVFTYRDTAILYSGGTIVNIGTLNFDSSGTMKNGRYQDVEGQSYTGSFPTMKRIN